MRAPRGDGRAALSFWTEPIRREQPLSSRATILIGEHLGRTTCPGGTAATDAQWGDRAFERQYRDRMGLRWLSFVCVFACTINRAPGMASIKREAHHARRTKMIRRY